MARAKVIHSTDSVQITFYGKKMHPEPSTAVIKFPGGHVEVSRCTDGSYWAHIAVVDGVNIVKGRIDRTDGGVAVETMNNAECINHIAVLVDNKVPHFNPDA